MGPFCLLCGEGTRETLLPLPACQNQSRADRSQTLVAQPLPLTKPGREVRLL